MGECGYRLALSGRWDEGCPLVEEARDRNPGPFAYYETGLALCSYFKGDYPRAVMWIRKTADRFLAQKGLCASSKIALPIR